MKDVDPPALSDEVLSIMNAARDVHQPNEIARARVRRGVELKLAAGVGLALGPATSVFAAVLKTALVAVVVSGAVAGGVYAVPHLFLQHHPASSSRPVSPARAPAPGVAPALEPSIGQLARPGTVETTPPAVRARHRPHVAAVENDDLSALAGETALLAAANGALARHDVADASALLSAYDRERAPSLLAEERAATGILVDCAAGRLDAARTAARRFRVNWPRSPLLARVDGSCAGRGPTPSEP